MFRILRQLLRKNQGFVAIVLLVTFYSGYGYSIDKKSQAECIREFREDMEKQMANLREKHQAIKQKFDSILANKELRISSIKLADKEWPIAVKAIDKILREYLEAEEFMIQDPPRMHNQPARTQMDTELSKINAHYNGLTRNVDWLTSNLKEMHDGMSALKTQAEDIKNIIKKGYEKCEASMEQMKLGKQFWQLPIM